MQRGPQHHRFSQEKCANQTVRAASEQRRRRLQANQHGVHTDGRRCSWPLYSSRARAALYDGPKETSDWTLLAKGLM